jgi:predicted aminopeptidase
MRSAHAGRVLRAALPVLVSAVLSACSPAYVLRAGYEEAKILWRREPITRVLQDPNLDAETRAKLELVLAVRDFARDTLALRVGGSYASFARVDADQAVHVVTAAYRDRLVPYTWWFPIVGRIPYKGYFSEEAARAEAAALEQQGLDTAVRPSTAFSTLGWFDDPLLSTLLRYDRVALVETVIHELLHNTAYPAGQAAFNESFATFAGHRGAILFFAMRGDEALRRQAESAWQAALAFGFHERLRGPTARGLCCRRDPGRAGAALCARPSGVPRPAAARLLPPLQRGTAQQRGHPRVPDVCRSPTAVRARRSGGRR